MAEAHPTIGRHAVQHEATLWALVESGFADCIRSLCCPKRLVSLRHPWSPGLRGCVAPAPGFAADLSGSQRCDRTSSMCRISAFTSATQAG